MSIFVGRKKIFLETVSSTNSYALELLRKEEVADGTLIRADFQTAGRGQRGNFWESDPGKNLTFSIVFYPEFVPPEEQFYLSKAISLGIADFLKTTLDGVTIKWPNDIYVQDRKIAGMLIETAITGNRITHCVVGIGLNVNQVVFRSDAPNPTSMKLRAARDFSLDWMLDILCTFIENRYLQLQTDFLYRLNSDYLTNLYRYNQDCYFDHDGTVFPAKIVDVEDNGRLVLETPDKALLRFAFKEVFFADKFI
jgi:BirA family transcriptional regulator, biotin operon repressor / biotin---[acetyl-CoA-carboxylase] ligase